MSDRILVLNLLYNLYFKNRELEKALNNKNFIRFINTTYNFSNRLTYFNNL